MKRIFFNHLIKWSDQLLICSAVKDISKNSLKKSWKGIIFLMIWSADLKIWFFFRQKHSWKKNLNDLINWSDQLIWLISWLSKTLEICPDLIYMSWPEVNDWHNMTRWFDQISWSNLADQQLIWSAGKKIYEKKNIFWMIWSVDKKV